MFIFVKTTPSVSKQIIPFPLPDYLREFLVSQINTPAQTLPDGSPGKTLHIRRTGEFGKLIHRCLKKSNKPAFVKEGFTMYLAVSNFAGDHDKDVPVGKYSFISLEEKEIKEIISVFDSWFKTCLVHFVDGAVFAHTFNGKTKGIVHASITQFMNYYKISNSKTKFDTFVKHYYREKKGKRQQLQRLT